MRRFKGKYPANWDEIADNIKDLAGWACEHCGHPHDPSDGYTLTVHHLDGNKSDCSYQNLVALCQRCHLSIQASYYPGQLTLFDPPAWMVARGLVERRHDDRTNQRNRSS